MATLVALFALIVLPCAVSSSPTATVDIDLEAQATRFPHIWKRSFGSGHAALGLREDWSEQLSQAVKDLGLQGRSCSAATRSCYCD